MKDVKLETSIAQYLADHPQALGHQQMRALSGYRRPYKFEVVTAHLTEEGFTVEQKNGDLHLTNALVSPSWCTGGITGGSCWGDEANQPVQGEEMPPWLEEFLEKVAPETSFLKFRRLQGKCTRYTYTYDEYYGNSTDYAFQVLKVSDILETLGA